MKPTIDIYFTPDKETMICWPNGTMPDKETVERVSHRIAEFMELFSKLSKSEQQEALEILRYIEAGGTLEQWQLKSQAEQ